MTGRRTVIRGAKFDIDEITLDGGLVRHVVRHPGAVVILPLLDDRVVLIRNQRHALGESLWEFPAGTMEPPEPPETCAARELVEETGYHAATIEPLTRFYTTPGMTDERMHAFIARGLEVRAQALEPDERITVHPTPIPQVWGMIDEGLIADAKTLVTWYEASRRGLI